MSEKLDKLTSWNIKIVKEHCPYIYPVMQNSIWYNKCELTRLLCNPLNCSIKIKETSRSPNWKDLYCEGLGVGMKIGKQLKKEPKKDPYEKAQNELENEIKQWYEDSKPEEPTDCKWYVESYRCKDPALDDPKYNVWKRDKDNLYTCILVGQSSCDRYEPKGKEPTEDYDIVFEALNHEREKCKLKIEQLISEFLNWVKGIREKVKSDYRDGRLSQKFRFTTLIYQLDEKITELEERLKHE